MIDSIRASGESIPASPRVESLDSATNKTTLTLGKPGDLKIPEGLELKGQNAQVNIVRPGGDSISVSDAAKELAQKLKDAKGAASGSTPTPLPQPTPPPVAPSGPPTTAQGTAVELDTSAGNPALNFTNTAGEKLSLSLNAGEDLHIKEHATGLSVLNKTTGTATQFNFDGTQTALEDTSAFADMSGDDIIVNMTQQSVNTGSGNDIVVNFADNAKISTGDGNDTLIYGQKTAVNVNADMGTGHDRVVGGALQGGSISGSAKAGEGSLRVDVDSVSNTSIQSPAPGRLPLPDMGNVAVSGGALNMGTKQPEFAFADAYHVSAEHRPQQSTVTMSSGTKVDYEGGGASLFKFTNSEGQRLGLNISKGRDMLIRESAEGITVFDKASGQAGLFRYDGSREMLTDTAAFADMSGDDIIVNATQKTVDAGDGNDLIINGVAGAHIVGGNGDDTLLVQGGFAGDDLTVDMGEGNDVVYGGSLNNADVSLGNGNDTLNVSSVHRSRIDAGEGNNSLRANNVSHSDVTAGDGNNKFQAYEVTAADITFGDGRNSVTATGSFGMSLSNVTVGNGNNRITVSGGSRNNVYAGDGTNFILGSYGAGNVVAGSGKNVISGFTPVVSSVEKPVALPETGEAAPVADKARSQNTTVPTTEAERSSAAEQTASAPTVSSLAAGDESSKAARMRKGVKVYAENASADTQAAAPQTEIAKESTSGVNKSMEWRMPQSGMLNSAKGVGNTDAFGLNAALQGTGGDKNSLMLDLVAEPNSAAFTGNVAPAATTEEAASM